MKQIKMISMDSSTSKTGVCIWSNGIYKESYVLENNPKIKGDEKLNQMIDFVLSLIKGERPDIVVIESVVPTRNAQSTRMLQELTGAIRGFCIEYGIEYISLRPSEWRSAVTKKYNKKPLGRKREDQKAWSLDIVNNILNVITDSDDQCDAILIGESYIEMCKEGR